MEDWPKCQISSLVKYRQNLYQNSIWKLLMRLWIGKKLKLMSYYKVNIDFAC